MASLLDLSLVGYFSNIFVILFVFATTFALLKYKKPFGTDDNGINALISATVALLFIFSQDAIDVIKNTIPWYLIMMIGLIFVVIISQAFGAEVPSNLKNSMGTYVLVIAIIILLINVSQKIGQTAGPYLSSNGTYNPDVVVANGQGDVGSSNFSQNFGATLFHPKVLALILVMVVSLFAVLWIGYRP